MLTFFTVHRVKFLIITVVFLISGGAGAWQRPDWPTKNYPITNEKAHLEHIVVEVNGEKKVLKNNATLKIGFGDWLRLDHAVLESGDAGAEVKLNIVGYRRKGGIPGQDKGEKVHTEDGLNAKWSENEQGKVYAVKVTSSAGFHGGGYIELIDPVLDHIEVTINRSPKLLREGEILDIKASDTIKVNKLVTNINQIDNVVFQIIEVNHLRNQTHEMRLLRGKKVFAKIPVNMEN